MERLFELIHATTDSIIWVSPNFQFRVIGSDPDDNAFTDCAIVANADYVITDDSDFAVLAGAGYRAQPILPVDFIERFSGIHVFP